LKERTEEGGEAGNRKRGKIGGSPLVEVNVNNKEETLKTFVLILSYNSASVQEKR
jgi:hypothetical protein